MCCIGHLDANQIKQIFLNLFLNAIDAMKNGGKLAIVTRSATDGAEIVIEDTGKGMPKHDLEHIFDPFYTTKEEGQGTGLGLSICYQIIKGMNGTIEILSDKLWGTKIKIVFEIKGKDKNDNSR